MQRKAADLAGIERNMPATATRKVRYVETVGDGHYRSTLADYSGFIAYETPA